jgi:histidine triad (HIT) family protein
LDPEKSEKDCIFCKIVRGEIPTAILYQDEDVVVFPDVKPVTPVHLLIVTRKHIPSLADMTDDDTPLVGKMVKVANRLAREQGISEKGYRLTINSGPGAGQVVPHLHLHFMGGRDLRWVH